MENENVIQKIEELTNRISELEHQLSSKNHKPKNISISFLQWPVILLVFVSIILMTAGDISGDKITFAGGTTISATDMNANFDALLGLVNGNIDSFNLAIDEDSLSQVSGGAMDSNSGNIGIGISDAQDRLHVVGPDGGYDLPSHSPDTVAIFENS
jgi:hypothetical protein